MREIFSYLGRMIPAAVLGLGLYALAWPVRSRRLKKKKLHTNVGHETLLLGFLMFLAGLLWLTVLPKVEWLDGRIFLREEGIGGMNWKPLMIFKQSKILAKQGNHTYFLINFWGNILMFVPIALFPALLWRGERGWMAVLSGFGLSLFIELSQIPIHRGTDVDDLWLNTLGAGVGYGLFCLIQRFVPTFVVKCRVQEEESWTPNGR